MVIYYDRAEVIFPEDEQNPETDLRGTLNGNTVSFSYYKLLINAGVLIHKSISQKLNNQAYVQKSIVRPTIISVLGDLGNVDDLLGEFFRCAKERGFPSKLEYRRNPFFRRDFCIPDQSEPSVFNRFKNYFSDLENFTVEQEKLSPILRSIEGPNEHIKSPYVKSDNFRNAVEMAIRIYGLKIPS